MHLQRLLPVQPIPLRRNRERPRFVEDLFAGLVHPHRVVPALADRQAIDTIILATAKMDSDGPVLVTDYMRMADAKQCFMISPLAPRMGLSTSSLAAKDKVTWSPILCISCQFIPEFATLAIFGLGLAEVIGLLRFPIATLVSTVEFHDQTRCHSIEHGGKC